MFPLQEAAASLLTKFTPPILTHPIQPVDSAQTNKADLLCVFAARAAKMFFFGDAAPLS